MLSQIEIETILKPNETKFEEVFYNTWQDYNNEYNNIRHIHSKRTRASLLRDHAVFHAKNIFSNTNSNGIEIVEKNNGLFLLEFSGEPFGLDGCVQMRLKKLNDNLLTSNVPTKQSRNFNSQQIVDFRSQPSLFGEPPKVFYPANVNLGYVAHPTFTGYSGLYITYPNGERSIGWFMRIGNAGENELGLGISNQPDEPQNDSNIVEFPMVETVIETNPRRRVSAKGSKNQEQKKVKINE